MTNLKQTIDAHNKATLADEAMDSTPSGCNCRNPANCPLPDNCKVESVIYQATISSDSKPTQTYIGLTGGPFKSRYNNHKLSFNCESKKHSTKLSEYIWELKKSNVNYIISWKVIKKAKTYNPASNRCNLCNWEKFYIICKPNMASLNKRNELISTF